MDQPNLMLQWALYYLDQGHHPIPVEPTTVGDKRTGKRPILSSWSEFFTRQPTRDEVMKWWTDTPTANIGLIQGRGNFVLDVDSESGSDALKLEGVELPEGPRVKTGKGWHYYLKGEAPNSVGVLPNVDVRSDGGYVVAPPSQHWSGAFYQWNGTAPMVGAYPPSPVRLLEIVNRPKTPVAAGARVDGWLLDALEGVGEGQRDIMCARLAGHFWGRGESQEVVERIMQWWGETCKPPFPADEITKTVNSICKREGGPVEAPRDAKQLFAKTVSDILTPPDKRPKLARTSIAKLDALLDGGFRPGNYILLAARPSVGKSALAIQMARDSASHGVPTLYCTAEMTEAEVAQWMLAQHCRVPQDVMNTGNLTPLDRDLLKAGAEALGEYPLWITSEVQTGEQLHETLQGFEQSGIKLGLVVVDYLQNLTAPGKEVGRHTIEHISRLLKRAAVKFNVPILVLSALVRPPRDADGWRPHLADLRESGKLEHDGDIILMMYRDIEVANGTLYVRKFKGGKAGTNMDFHFEGRFLTFTEAQ